jgi:hypothetical protein
MKDIEDMLRVTFTKYKINVTSVGENTMTISMSKHGVDTTTLCDALKPYSARLIQGDKYGEYAIQRITDTEPSPVKVVDKLYVVSATFAAGCAYLAYVLYVNPHLMTNDT